MNSLLIILLALITWLITIAVVLFANEKLVERIDKIGDNHLSSKERDFHKQVKQSKTKKS